MSAHNFVTFSAEDLASGLRRFCEQFVTHAGDDRVQLYSDTSFSPGWGLGDPATWRDWLESVWPSAGIALPSGRSAHGAVRVQRGGEAWDVRIRELARSTFHPVDSPDTNGPIALPERGAFDEVFGYCATAEYLSEWFLGTHEPVAELIERLPDETSSLWMRAAGKWARLATEAWAIDGPVYEASGRKVSGRVVFADGTNDTIGLGEYADAPTAELAWERSTEFIGNLQGLARG